MNKELVTVGISLYNNEASIARCLKSVLNQSYHLFELILINDGSTDNSDKVIQPFLKDSRIRYFDEPMNMGVAARRNQITRLAKGEFIAKLDADDFMVKDRLQIQLDFMKEHPEIDMVSSYAFGINSEHMVSKRFSMNGQVNKSKFGLLLKNNIIHSTVFGKRDFFYNNPYNEKFLRCQDLELWLRTYDKYQFALIKQPLVYYYIGNEVNKYLRSQVYLALLLKKYKNELTWAGYYVLKTLVNLKKTIKNL